MCLRLYNRLCHPIPYPGAELIPYDESAIIEEPDLASDTCLEDFGTDYFVKYCPSTRSGSPSHNRISELSDGSSASRQGSSPFDKRSFSFSRGDDEPMPILQPLISSVSHSQPSLTPSPGSPSPTSPSAPLSPPFFFMVLANKNRHLMPAHCPGLLVHHDFAELIHHGSFSRTVPTLAVRLFSSRHLLPPQIPNQGESTSQTHLRQKSPPTPTFPCSLRPPFRPHGFGYPGLKEHRNRDKAPALQDLVLTQLPRVPGLGHLFSAEFPKHDTTAPKNFLTGLFTSAPAKTLAMLENDAAEIANGI